MIGFDRINDTVLKDLVVARICQPRSKAATVEYLKSYYDEDVDLSNIYRYLNVLQSTQQEKVQQISVAHTRKILGGKIGIVFYDVTDRHNAIKCLFDDKFWKNKLSENRTK